MQARSGMYLGNLGPVPLFIDPSAIFLLIFVLGFWGGSLSVKLVALAVIVLSVVLHELGHAAVAIWRRAEGVTICITGLGGYCSYAPFSDPKSQVLIAMAGPAVTLFLAVLGYVLMEYVPIDLANEQANFLLQTFIFYLFILNLFMGILNSLPIYPMDGGQTVLAALQAKGCSQHRSRKIALITSFIAAGVGVVLYVLLTGKQMDMFLTLLLFYLLYQAYTDLT